MLVPRSFRFVNLFLFFFFDSEPLSMSRHDAMKLGGCLEYIAIEDEEETNMWAFTYYTAIRSVRKERVAFPC